MIIKAKKQHYIKNNNRVEERLAYHLRIQKKWIKRYGFIQYPDFNLTHLDHFILINKNEVVEPNIYIVGCWFEKTKERFIKSTVVNGCWTSTVFLSFNHAIAGAPLLYETMIFGSAVDLTSLYKDRYSTYDDALKGHQKAVRIMIKLANKKRNEKVNHR